MGRITSLAKRFYQNLTRHKCYYKILLKDILYSFDGEILVLHCTPNGTWLLIDEYDNLYTAIFNSDNLPIDFDGEPLLGKGKYCQATFEYQVLEKYSRMVVPETFLIQDLEKLLETLGE